MIIVTSLRDFEQYVKQYCLDESEEDEAAPPLSKRRRASQRAADGREPIEEVSSITTSCSIIQLVVLYISMRYGPLDILY